MRKASIAIQFFLILYINVDPKVLFEQQNRPISMLIELIFSVNNHFVNK